jgi:MFS family permease
MFVSDYAKRTFWFAVFILLGNISNSLLSSGVTAWHMNFLPEGHDRNIYFSYSNLISSVVGTFVAVTSSIFVDSLKDFSEQSQIINILRFIAVGLFIADGLLLYLIPREFPYLKSENKIKILNIFNIPIHAKKFMLTAFIIISWNFIANVNSNTWNYYVLNTIGIGYTYMYIGSVVNAICGIFLLRYWREAIIRYSSFTILFVTVFITGLLELFIAFSTKDTKWVYIIVSVLQGFNSIGTNLVFANLFYVNLPKENTDVFISFWNFAANMSILAGSILGTWFISLTEQHGRWILFGLPFYGSQFLVWIKFILFMGVCIYLKLIGRRIRPDQ